ncbi:MAG TPA: hypothetical protein PKE51_06995 [Gemmatimonadaceae bacterium]|nr:hypothetical protein [Gemmatimonadaceae bacterium]
MRLHTPTLRRVGIACALLLLGRTGATLEAQDQPAVFVHGLKSDGSTWSTVRPLVETELQITGTAPTLSWGQVYATQAANLHAALAGSGNVIAVTHSNGGVLTRTYLTSNGSPRVNRHVSINSPHRGATLAASALNGQLTQWAADLFFSIIDPFQYYYLNDPGFHGAYQDWNPTASLVRQAPGNVHVHAAVWGFVADVSAPVLWDMVPGSGQLDLQLSATALGAEAAVTSHRFSIASEVDLNLQPYALFWENPGQLQQYVFALTIFADQAREYYETHPDFALRQYAFLWANLVDQLATVPMRWSQLIGAFTGTGIAFPGWLYFTADPNDGVVPWPSSDYPGGTPLYMDIGVYGNQPHTTNLTSPALASFLVYTLRQQLNVPDRTPVPPPVPALGVSIQGASLVAPYELCSYSASVSNGAAPFSFQWYIDGVPSGNTSYLTYSFVAPFTEVTVVVTDATSATASAQLGVVTDPYAGGGGCF